MADPNETAAPTSVSSEQDLQDDDRLHVHEDEEANFFESLNNEEQVTNSWDDAEGAFPEIQIVDEDELSSPITATSPTVKFPRIIPPIHAAAHYERKKILHLAKKLGEQREKLGLIERHLTVVYNPISGKGIAKSIVEHMVVPILELAKVSFRVVPTEYRGFAVEFASKLDLVTTEGLLVVGGDGLVREVLNGLLSRTDDASKHFPLGIIPAGSANAMATTLHVAESYSHTNLVGYATLVAARGELRRVDVMKIEIEGTVSYALSCVGWGIAGAVAQKADELRWIPGQKKMRYDIAGFVTLLQDWPIRCGGEIEWSDDSGIVGDEEPVRRREPFELVNMIVANMASLGRDNCITDDIEPDDGYVKIVMCDSSMDRMKVVKLAMKMKKGCPLITGEGVKSMRTKEFTIYPHPGNNIPLNVDGDPISVRTAAPVHITVLHRRLPLFAATMKTEKLLSSFGRAGSTLSINSIALLEQEQLDDYFDDIETTTHRPSLLSVDGTPSSLRDDSSLSQSVSIFSSSTSTTPTPSSSNIAGMPRIMSEPVPSSHHLGDVSPQSTLKGVQRRGSSLPSSFKTTKFFFDKERKKYLARAFEYGEVHQNTGQFFTVLYNPMSGKGHGRKIVEHLVVPMLQAAHLPFSIHPCDKPGDAERFILSLDTENPLREKPRSILVVGGDGLFHEAVNGVMKSSTPAQYHLAPIAGGSANALANELHVGKSPSSIEIVGECVLNAFLGKELNMDIMQVEMNGKTIYCHCVIGWGIAGLIAQKASHYRWVPGSKRVRYDLAGIITLLKDWPIEASCKLRYQVSGTDKWKEEVLPVGNVVISSLPRLGVDHAISPDVTPIDGRVAIILIDGSISRRKFLKYAFAMKKGHFLSKEKGIKTIYTNEFFLTPTSGTIPFNFDGDPVPVAPIHVKVLPRALSVYTARQYTPHHESYSSMNSLLKTIKHAVTPRIPFISPKSSPQPSPKTTPKTTPKTSPGTSPRSSDGFFPPPPSDSLSPHPTHEKSHLSSSETLQSTPSKRDDVWTLEL